MKILIPLDGSIFAEEILEPVKKLAGRGKGRVELHLLRVVDPEDVRVTWIERPTPSTALAGEWTSGGPLLDPMRSIAGESAETRDQALDRLYNEADYYLGQVAERFFPEVAEKTVVFGGDAAEEILAYADSVEPDLIAIATHGRTGLAKLRLGSVAAKLLKARAYPLFMVRPDGLHGKDAGLEALPESEERSDLRLAA